MSDMISRQTAISAICNACGKIDCDKMDKCEKLQLPPANSSEIPNNSDTISRQAAIDVADAVWSVTGDKNVAKVWDQIKDLPSVQPEPQWIPVSEGLPKKDGRYQVSRHDDVTNTEFIDILWYEKNTWWNRYSTGNYAVTAWMPLPEPYREGEQDENR